ncbi:hypothetical protein E2C01_034175 [Portunus trituberculatus]|uniref:Uncharacterized protein n=1 Tax=Portunus trituberculatus TaxID=210409 RepID=A0A5B7F251_PORTR|nr:hypothetical protein [Portunus trituberculatus]
MDGRSDSDLIVSNSATSSAHLTSTPRVSRHVVGIQLLNESGIRRALELTVSTIIESEDSDVLGSDTDVRGSTTSNSYCICLPAPVKTDSTCLRLTTRHDAYSTSDGIHKPSYQLRVTTSHARSQDTRRTDDDCTLTGRQHEGDSMPSPSTSTPELTGKRLPTLAPPHQHCYFHLESIPPGC